MIPLSPGKSPRRLPAHHLQHRNEKDVDGSCRRYRCPERDTVRRI
ncbi:Uncharacterised protein [Acinetobacter baumannii]|nr:Uncharacterised protein [Acinetobacter baumannii]